MTEERPIVVPVDYLLGMDEDGCLYAVVVRKGTTVDEVQNGFADVVCEVNAGDIEGRAQLICRALNTWTHN